VAWGDWGTVSLAAYLGAEVELGMDTIWYHPRPGGLADWGELVFDPEHPWFRTQLEIYRRCVAAADGDFCIGQPGLGSNIEVLAALRGSQALMVDLLDDPGLVRARLEEINHAFFVAFGRVAEVIRLPSGGVCSSYFAIYGPGRTSVVTLDPVAMISPAMFREFVVAPLRVQLGGRRASP
jgi:hypothetical protein